MIVNERLRELGFSKYEISCYLALVNHHPANGSQISRLSGVSRSRIYDILRKMLHKGLVNEIGEGLYLPLPPEELIKRLKSQFDSNLALLKEEVDRTSWRSDHEHIWTLRGLNETMGKAQEMTASAEKEIYIRCFPMEGRLIDSKLHQAVKRGVLVKYISMGPPLSPFEIQVVHPGWEHLERRLDGRCFDLITDRKEVLVGKFQAGKEDQAPFKWTRSHWFVTSSRDSLRHDFFHYFLNKIHEEKKILTLKEQEIYQLIKEDY